MTLHLTGADRYAGIFSFSHFAASSSRAGAGSCAALPFIGVSIYLLWVGITQSGAAVRKRYCPCIYRGDSLRSLPWTVRGRPCAVGQGLWIHGHRGWRSQLVLAGVHGLPRQKERNLRTPERVHGYREPLFVGCRGHLLLGMKLAFANDLWNRVVVSPSAAGVPCDPALYRYCRVRSAHWAGRT